MDICYKRYLIKENGRLIKFMEDGYNINLKKNQKVEEIFAYFWISIGGITVIYF